MKTPVADFVCRQRAFEYKSLEKWSLYASCGFAAMPLISGFYCSICFPPMELKTNFVCHPSYPT